MKRLHYEQSGDDYFLKDRFKRMALKGARKTARNLERFYLSGIKIEERKRSRGESAYCFSVSTRGQDRFILAHVVEGIGTKNVAADDLVKEYGPRVYFSSALDNAASVFNDLSTKGAVPLSFLLHLGAFPNEIFSDKEKMKAIIAGTVEGCNLARASWGGGESPTLRDIIKPGRMLLSGSATGIIYPAKKELSEEKIEESDRIILLGSSGVGTNGITLLRKELVKRLPQRYKTKLSDGTTYGEALLTPSIIYSPVIEEALQRSEIHYAVAITGHGFRKIMRSRRQFHYIIDAVPKPQPIFDTIKKYSKSTDKGMYDSYNMGAGFAIFVPKSKVEGILKICEKQGVSGIDAGYISRGRRSVTIKPLGIRFQSRDMVLGS